MAAPFWEPTGELIRILDPSWSTHIGKGTICPASVVIGHVTKRGFIEQVEQVCRDGRGHAARASEGFE